jgi:hypothetical protein
MGPVAPSWQAIRLFFDPGSSPLDHACAASMPRAINTLNWAENVISRILKTAWKSVSLGHRPLIVLLGLGVLVGVLVGRDYGLSVDEERNAGVGELALQAYTGSPIYFDQPNLDEHGPAYFMLFAETSRLVDHISPQWTLADGRHLTNYMMFMFAVASIYFLSLRFVSRGAALTATALFATQPLLFGQAFINQKDIPFLALVLVSLTVGLTAVDRLPRPRLGPAPGIQDGDGAGSSRFRDELQQIPLAKAIGLGLTSAAILIVGLDLVLGGVIRGAAEGLLASAYAGHAPTLIQVAFDRVATDAYKTPLALYMDKFNLAWFVVRMAAAVFLVATAWVVLNLVFPKSAKERGWSWRQAWSWHWNRWVVLAAVLLGLTICVRQLGLFFGVLVSLYALYRCRARALVPLAIYWSIALVVTTVTWPYLWPSPVVRFISSLYLSANFPDTHVTFYRGAWLRAGTYPWYFFPNLAGVELTEPAVVLILAGLILAVRRVTQRPAHALQTLFLGAWITVPLVGLIAFHMTTYGNITHLLFVLPAFFILAAIAFDSLFPKIPRLWIRAILIALFLVPGVWGIVSLHPYEYIYFNSLTGGVSGAADFYEMDRWCISTREAIQDVNQIARPGATVMLPSSTHQAIPFARPDLHLIDNRTSYDQAQFVIQCSWIHGLGPWPKDEFQRIADVRRGKAVLSSIWERTTPP